VMAFDGRRALEIIEKIVVSFVDQNRQRSTI
jgi:hypothetical protein